MSEKSIAEYQQESLRVACRQNQRRQIAALPCGCMYVDTAFVPALPCEHHRYMTCARCNGQAEVTPFGLICRCTFNGDLFGSCEAGQHAYREDEHDGFTCKWCGARR